MIQPPAPLITEVCRKVRHDNCGQIGADTVAGAILFIAVIVIAAGYVKRKTGRVQGGCLIRTGVRTIAAVFQPFDLVATFTQAQRQHEIAVQVKMTADGMVVLS